MHVNHHGVSEADTFVPKKDEDIAIRLVVGQDTTVYVFHDQPFAKSLSWLEYDLDRSNLDFIMDDGDIRNFGIAVDPELGAYMQNNHNISVVLTRDHEHVVSGEVLPLIVHRA